MYICGYYQCNLVVCVVTLEAIAAKNKAGYSASPA